MTPTPAPFAVRVVRALRRALVRLVRSPRFALYFVWQLVLANVRVATEVLTPGYAMSAGIVRFPSRCATDLEVTFLANFITLTPGTTSLEVEPDTRAIHVHGLYVTDRDAFLADLTAMEDEVLRFLR